MTMTKEDMVKIICERIGFVSKESTEIVDQVFEILKEILEGGDVLVQREMELYRLFLVGCEVPAHSSLTAP